LTVGRKQVNFARAPSHKERIVNKYSTHVDIGTVRIQRGFEPKRGGSGQDLHVSFEVPFEGLPTVTVTTVWENYTGEVGHVEFITQLTESGFVCTSRNAADGFGIMWIAVGVVPTV
jgi:hypothetical protein